MRLRQRKNWPKSWRRTRRSDHPGVSAYLLPALQTIDALDSTLRSYLNPEQSNQVRRAYFFAEQAHYGQLRRSGEPYVTHPLAVAGILADMHMDHQSLMAVMLHDVIEDTGIDKSAIGGQFGATVAELVEELRAREERYALAFADLKALRVAVDQDLTGFDAPLAGAREVAFFPPMTGG